MPKISFEDEGMVSLLFSVDAAAERFNEIKKRMNVQLVLEQERYGSDWEVLRDTYQTDHGNVVEIIATSDIRWGFPGTVKRRLYFGNE